MPPRPVPHLLSPQGADPVTDELLTRCFPMEVDDQYPGLERQLFPDAASRAEQLLVDLEMEDHAAEALHVQKEQ